MKLTDFDYNLPPELIAQNHAMPRDHSRLLILDKNSGQTSHDFFYNLPRYLKKDDLLVLNNSAVFPARLFGTKAVTGGKVEILLNKELGDGRWEVIGKGLKLGARVSFASSPLSAAVTEKKDEICRLQFNMSGEKFYSEIDKIGTTPLPPYIKKEITSQDKRDYQTVYAKEKGSAAAPTAGLHFTKELLLKLKQANIDLAEVTLHVGLGTFAPVKEANVLDHKIHSENYFVSTENIAKILQAKKEGRRVIAVGTTATRVLEHLFSKYDDIIPKDYSGSTEIFIYPGYQFKCIDGLITNFHLPKSTLLMLVSALAGRENILNAYNAAIEKGYRFFSYGDAMLIL